MDCVVHGDSAPPTHALIRRGARRRAIWRQSVFVGVVAFLGGTGGLALVSGAPPYPLPMLAAASLGLAAGCAAAAAALRREGRQDTLFAQALLAATSDGVAVVKEGEHLVEVNCGYLRLTQASESQAPTPERFLGRIPGAQAPLAVLLRAVADHVSASQWFAFDSDPDGRRLRVTVYPLAGARRVLWVLALVGRATLDLESERAGVGSVVERAAQAEPDGARLLVDLWERAPLGLAVLDASGLRLPNGTCARLLGYDLAEWGVGSMALDDIVAAGSLEDVRALALGGSTDPGGLAADLIGRDGAVCAVRLWTGGHKDGASILAVLPRCALAPAPQAAGRADAPLVEGSQRGSGADADVFSRSPLAMAMVDMAGRVIEANGSFSRLFATNIAFGEDARLEHLVLERDAAAVERLVRETLAGTTPAPPVDVGIGGAGGRSARLYAATLGPNAPGIAVYAVETTAQRALEVQFAQSQKMQAIGQLAGGIAHDFNNVLTAILGYCDLLLANHRPSDPSFPDIMQIKQNANRAAGLVRQLLAFSRRQTLRPQVIQLTDVISDLSMLLRRLIGESITLHVEHGRDLWPVKVDVNQFEQVIVNLAVNARDAMPDGGALTLRTANVSAQESAAFADEATLQPADHVLVEVTDTGTGIAPDILDKIFEPFFSTKDVGKGTGLGLSTVYGIVKQTGGGIQVSSSAGEGTTFRVFLPRHVPSQEESEPKAPEPEAKAGDLTGQATVLLVEDEDAVRAFASRALAARGYHVLTAASGVEALAAFEQSAARIELVISDVVMPEMDGPMLLKELRARDPGLKVIFISGYAEEAFARSLPEGEKFSFLPKPFTLKQLVAAVKEATRR